MTFKDICNMPINKIANDNSVLLMWVVDPLLDKAFEVINGGVSSTRPLHLLGQRRIKLNKYFFTGLGYWTRGNLKCVYLQQKVNLNESVNQYLN